MHLESILEKLKNSFHGKLSKEEIRDLVQTLVKQVPDWCSIVKSEDTNSEWLKINKKQDLVAVKRKLENEFEQKYQNRQ